VRLPADPFDIIILPPSGKITGPFVTQRLTEADRRGILRYFQF